MNKQTPTRANVIVLKELLNLIPLRMINRIARETGIKDKSRSFTVLSHLSAMLFAQLSRAMGLNDVCDWFRLKASALARFGVAPPSRNGLSNANKERDALFAENLFWSVLADLQHACPSFASGNQPLFPRLRSGQSLFQRPSPQKQIPSIKVAVLGFGGGRSQGAGCDQCLTGHPLC